eukprot:CAMPEP_0119545582 /NCGR_PEP_ID=MMETSP1352-20130426/288_1 /TAXON_ID=265584 /ORGANISM="Stauroneis constricta, Strain CCMP1120" /LENGTH=365 /DNA_ID=CAMNT_0007590147 /DNA_START=59 /DNA_END=1156 /DNA_ORIENTATION=-
MMDAVVQLLRNALCCVKDLQLFSDTFIHDANRTNEYLVGLPEPLNKTTPLEVIISVTQLYACISTTKAGWRLLTTSIGKLQRIKRLTEQRESPKTAADRIINESLLKEAKYAFRSTFVGVCVTPIGVAFFWLFANSWHVTETDWIGGLPALIHALEVMEVCLIPLLYYMIIDGFEMLRKSKLTDAFLDKVRSRKVTPDDITTQMFEAMTGWLPFWDSGTGMFAKADAAEDKMMEKELLEIQKTLDVVIPSDKSKKDRKEKLEAIEDKLETKVFSMRMEGYREFLYFVFNFVAFYGYLMAPLCFYYEDNEQPTYVRSLKFSYQNELADWHGNFAGDFMWTIEPIVILGSPMLITWMKPASKKIKSD